MLSVQPSYAQTSNMSGTSMTNYLLTLIVGTTWSILALMNQTPAYLSELTEMAKSWNQTDDPANTVGNNQYIFASLGTMRVKNQADQLSMTQSLILQFLQAGSFNASKPVIPSNANELSYTILFGVPLIKPPTNSFTSLTQAKADYTATMSNYIRNASASTLILEQPNPNWPDNYAKKQYIRLYNTLTAMQSYNQYLISGLSNLKNIQESTTNLSNLATSPDWFKQISTEPLGLVIRHILMYSSQSFVQSNQIVELQQKQLAAQAMTNSLLVVLVQANVGGQLKQAAQGQSQSVPSSLQ
jgi:hypothetical protein